MNGVVVEALARAPYKAGLSALACQPSSVLATSQPASMPDSLSNPIAGGWAFDQRIESMSRVSWDQ